MQRPIVELMLQPMVVATREGIITRNLILQSATMQTFITLTTPIPSGSEVTMLVYPTNGNSGLPAGAPSVTNNVFQTITFTLTADMLYVAREGSNYFSGFIANLVGPGINEAIDEDLSTPNLGWGTASASLSSQFSEPYTQLTEGFLQVANQALISTTPVLGDDSATELSNPVVAVTLGESWRVSAAISNVVGIPTGSAGWTGGRGAPSTAPFRLTGSALSVGAMVGGDFDITSTGNQTLFGRSSAQVAYNQISAQRLLRFAP